MPFMTRLTLFIGSSVLILLAILSCSKSNHGPLGHSICENGVTHMAVTDPDLVALRFKEGSWWLFQDSMNTSFKDTLFIQYVVSGETSPHEYSCDYSDQYSMSVWCRYMPEHYDRKYYFNPWKFATSSTSLLSPETFMELPKNAPNNPCKFYDSLLVNTKYYKNIIKSDTVRYTYMSVAYKMICYFNSTDGFVRNDIFDQNNQLLFKRWLIGSNVIKQ
jgi:hypothetical protein